MYAARSYHYWLRASLSLLDGRFRWFAGFDDVHDEAEHSVRVVQTSSSWNIEISL